MPVNKKTIIGGIALLVLMGATLYALLQGQQISLLLDVLGQVKPGWVLAGLALMLIFVGSEAVGTKFVLARLGHKTKYLRCLGYSFVGFYFSSITPTSSGGQPAQIYCMSRDGIPAALGALNMMLLGVGYQVVSILYTVIALICYPALLTAMGTGLGLLLLYGAGVMLVLTTAILLFMFQPNVARGLSGHVLALLAKLRIVKNRAAAEQGLKRQLEEYQAGARCIRANPSLAVGIFALTFVQLTALFAVPFTAYGAFGLTGYGAFEMICAQALLNLAVSMLPLPGAMGASEGGFVRFFSIFFGANLVTPAVLISRGISFYAALMISAAITLLVQFLARGRTRRSALQNA